jgi:toxin ParE1/3/4
VPDNRPTLRNLRLSGPAQRDILAILKWSRKEFGQPAALRYKALIKQALRDICADPELPGSMERQEILIEGVRTYHLAFSKSRVKGLRVKEPRHFLLYRQRDEHLIEMARVIHDSRDLTLNVPEEYQRR